MKTTATYTLYLFGWPRLERDGQPVAVETRKALALLAYLATSGERQSRDKLAALFWPDYDQSRSRANLRRVLWSVKKALGEGYLEADQDSVRLPVNGRLWVDTTQFGQLITEAESHSGTLSDSETGLAGLVQAVGLYQDEFLAGFSLDDSPKFDEWQRQQSRQLAHKQVSALSQLVDVAIAQGDMAGAARYAQHWLALDELNETAHRQLMQIYAWNDNRAAALRQYQECTTVLDAELGVVPEEATTELYETIRNGRLQPPIQILPASPGATEQLQPIPPNPYRGLFAFREEDAHQFFGREAFTHDLITAVHRQSLVALFGSSGSGKSSVMRAGLIANLRADKRWSISLFRPSSRPFHALAAALVPCLSPGLTSVEQLAESAQLAAALQDGSVSLSDVIDKIAHSREGGGRFLLIADQFEELYTLCPEADLRRTFLDVLLKAVNAQSPHEEPRFTFLFGLRADFLGQALNYRPFADAIQYHDIKLSPMNDLELRRAIQQPAQLENVQFEVGLIGRILTGVGDEPGNLPLLQFALTTLWQRQQNRLISHEAYKAIGKVAGALSVYADEVMAELTLDKQVAARRIFVQLVRPGEGTEDTRRLATRAELGEENWRLVRKLADARLVVTSRDALGQNVVEVAHEALIRGWACLREWMTADRAFRVWQERMRVSVRQWEATDHDTGVLLRGLSLEEAESWLRERPFEVSELEKAFVQASVVWREEMIAQQVKLESDRMRLRKRTMVGVAVAFLLMIALTVTAVWQWRQAVSQSEAVLVAEQQVALERTQAMTMLSRQLALHGESLLPDQFVLGSLLSVEAVNTAETVAAKRSLLAALNAEPTLAQIAHGHSGAVTAVVYGPDGEVISGDVVGSLQIWDMAGGETAVINVADELGYIKELVVNSDQSLLAVSGQEGVVQLWDLQKQQLREQLSVDNQSEIVSIDIRPDGLLLAALTQDRRLLLWDIATGVLTEEIMMPSGIFPTVLAFSRDGRNLVVGDDRGSVRTWDLATVEQADPTMMAHDGAVTDVLFSPNGRLLATAGEDGAVRLWQAATGQPVGDPLLGHDGRIYDIAFNQNGRLLASAGHDGSVRMWQVDDAQFLVDVLTGHTGQVLDLSFSLDGQTLVSGSTDHTLIVWSMTGHPAAVEEYAWLDQDVFAVALAPDSRLVAAGNATGDVGLWDLQTQEFKMLPGIDLLQIEALAFSEDGQRLTAVDQQNSVAQWDMDTGQLLQPPVSLPGQGWGPVKFSPDEKALVYTMNSGRIGVWDIDMKQLITAVTAQTSVVFDNFALSHNGRYLAVPNCFDIQIGPDNQFCQENNMRLWDLEEESWADDAFAGSYSMIVDTAFSPDDAVIAAVKQDGTLAMWHVDSGEAFLVQTVVPTAFNIQSIQFSPDGNTLAIGVETGDVLFWDVASETIIGTLPTREGIVSRLPMSFSDDSQSFVTGNVVGDIVVWNLQPLVWQQLICDRIQRNLTEAEWAQYMGDIPYRETCVGLE